MTDNWPGSTGLGNRLSAYLFFTAAFTGAMVMVIEVLGSRVIGPYFGVSLFVWTALIAATLLSLSAGYAIGGKVADRHPSPDWLYGFIFAAGLLVAAVPILKAPVIEASSRLGLRAGALVAACLLFAPALLLLGCVSPLIVRVAAPGWQRLGRTVGLFYAVSTMGSFAGTVLSGFFIIACIGVSMAFYWCGFLLCLLASGYFIFFRKRYLLSLLLPALLFPIVMEEKPNIEARMPDGTSVVLLDSADSFYGNVKVVEYRGNTGKTREMMIDGLIQGGIDPANGKSVYEYSYLMEHLSFAAKPDIRSALLIGLGPGVVVEGFQRRGVATTVVDIDPLVVRMAEKYFGFRPQQPVVVADGRYALGDRMFAGYRYDAILMDVFNGDITPGRLLSREAIAQVRLKLSPDGVFALNLIGSLDPASRLLPSIVRTLRTQFTEVLAFPLFDPRAGTAASGNLVILAGNTSLEGALGLKRILDVHPLAQLGVEAALTYGMRLPDYSSAEILSDDYNPLDVMDPELHEGVRQTILKTTPASILLQG